MAWTFATVSPSNSPAESYRDLSQKRIVSVIGPDFTPDERKILMGELGLTIGGNIDFARVETGIKGLIQRGRMQSLLVEAEPDGDGIRLILKGNRIRVLKGWIYDLADERLARAIRSRLKWEEGMAFDSRHIETWRTESLAALASLGYENAEIQFTFEEDEGEPKPTTIRVRAALGEASRVGSIEWQGAPPELKGGLTSRLRFKEGGILRRSDMEDSVADLENYLRDNQYPEAKVSIEIARGQAGETQRKVIVRFNLGGRYLITFFGNEVYDEFTLRTWIRAENASMDSVGKSRALIEKKYREVGYAFAKVEVVQREVGTQGAKLTEFRITEGPRVRIDSIKITSRDLVGAELPLAVFESVEKGVMRSGFFYEEGLREAMVDFRAEILRRGYLNPIVSEPKWFFSDDKKGVRILFDLDLGRQTSMGGLEVMGLKSMSNDEAATLLGFQAGAPFDRERLNKGRKAFLDKLKSQGYWDAKVSPGEEDWIQFPVNKSVANLVMNVEEGPQYRVGKITIRGNRRTREEVIRRELRIHEGDVLDPEKIRKSEEEVSVLGIFNRVEVKTEDAEGGRKNLVVVVRESEPGVGEVGLGGLYEDPLFRLRAFAGIAYRNVAGLNHTVSTRGELALPISKDKFVPFVEYGAQVGYRAPYLLGLPFIANMQVGLDSFQISAVGPGIQTRARIEGKIEKKLTDQLTLFYRVYRFERTKNETLDGSTTTTINSIGSTGPGFVFDRRDDPFNPTRGSYHTVDLEFSHPSLLSSNGVGFLLTVSRNSFYLPLVGPLSLTVFGGLGYAQGVFGHAIPSARLVNELALGGQPSIRGFDLRGLSPAANNASPNKTAYWNLRSEVACVIFGNFSAAVFMDSGQIFPNLTAGVQKTSIGGGFRYKTPVGPVVIDVAQGLNHGAGGARFYFTVGTL